VSGLPYEQLMAIQAGSMSYRHRGLSMYKNPFDLALYPILLDRLRPRTLIEIGSGAGGSALWFADQARIAGLDLRVVSVDLRPPTGVEHPAVEFLEGDARALEAVLRPGELARPLLVVEDASHQAGTTAAVLDFFDRWLEPGEYIVVEDGILTAMRVPELYDGGPLRAIHEFLAREGDRYEIDRSLCDYFGANMTWNVDGYLRRRAPAG
jgi:cephalosporin hydroxylase